MKLLYNLLILYSFTMSSIYAEDMEEEGGGNAIHEFDALQAAKRVEYVELRNKAAETMQLNKPFTALVALSDAEAIFSRDAHLHYLKGYVYSQIHLYEDARASYAKALRCNENHINSLMNLLELNFYLKDYKKAIYWYGKTIDVIGNKTSPLIEFKYYISVAKLSRHNGFYKKMKDKVTLKYTYMDDNPYSYYVRAIEEFEKGDKEEFFNLIYSATSIFNDVTLIKHWNKALEDSGYLKASEIILRPKAEIDYEQFTK